MEVLSGDEEGEKYIQKAGEVARRSGCEDARCGSVIAKDGEVIGKGRNSPPRELESQRRCSESKEDHHRKVTDKTCCMHAEERAIIDALKNNPTKIKGASLYFTRVNDKGSMEKSNTLYCTICSKLILDVGIKEVVMWNGEDFVVYDIEEYNDLSYQYGK